MLLPDSPAARLTAIKINHRKVPARTLDDTNKKAVGGLYEIVRFYLPRLKYHNPWLKVDVSYNQTNSQKITLLFEGTDPAAIKAVSLPRAAHNAKVMKDSRLAARAFVGSKSADTAEEAEVIETAQPDDSIADRTSSPADGSAVIRYQRSVGTEVSGKRADQIWEWLRWRIGATPETPNKKGGTNIPASQEDITLAATIERNKRRAKFAAEKGAIKIARREKEKADLEAVKKLAERNAAEATAMAGGA